MSGGRPKVLSQADVRMSTAPVRIGEGQAAAQPVHQSEIKVEHNSEGDVIRIRVECRCGGTTVIDCDYAAAS